jgi:hypothetical protein
MHLITVLLDLSVVPPGRRSVEKTDAKAAFRLTANARFTPGGKGQSQSRRADFAGRFTRVNAVLTVKHVK